MTMKNVKGSLILLITALIWGTAFVAQTSASGTVNAFTFNMGRSVVAAMFLIIVIGVRKLIYIKKKPTGDNVYSRRQTVVGGIICGMILFAANNFQQFGIGMYPEGVAASGRAGFLTATYVVMVSVAAIFFGKKPHPLVWVSAVGCIGGMYMLCLSGGISGVYKADIFLLVCAVCYTAHIITISRFPLADGLVFSLIQFVVCGVLSGIAMAVSGVGDISALLSVKFELFFAGVMSSGIAYTLQILGQKYAEPAVASIVLSLESVFSALAGWVVLNERLTNRELIGCALVFISVMLAQMPSFFVTKRTQKECEKEKTA